MNRILYLHGFASSTASSKARFFAERLRAAGALIDIPDLAAGDFEHLTISGQLRVIETAAAGEPVALMGSSMGGYLAAIYAARHPEVSRVVLLAPAFGFARRWAERIGAAAVDTWRTTGAVEVFHYAENRQRRLSYALLDDGLGYEDYPDFGQPALIFHGAQDDVVPALAVLGVVKDFDRAGCAPGIDRGGADAFGPAAREAKGRRQQYHARHFRMAGGVDGGEVAPHAAAHERHRLAGGRGFDHAQLPADGEVLEIAGREIGDVDEGARGAQAFGEESGFAGRRG